MNPKIDFVLVTALPEERDAILNKLPGYKQLLPNQTDIRTYYQADIPITFTDNSTGLYRVIVMCLLGMGRVQAATATADAIRRWQPRYIVLVGIAGGVADRNIAIGDVIISDQIVDYELQKLTPCGPEVRWDVQRADPRLLEACINYRSESWQESIQVRRPRKGSPARHIGPIASGDKVIAFIEVLAKYRDDWPKLIGVEMEAGGVATVAFQSANKPGFFMIRCVSDLADEEKSSSDVKKWRANACDTAAAFTIGFLKSGPIPLSENISGGKTKRVELLLDGEFNEFTSSRQKDIVNLLATLLSVDPSHIRILRVHQGSIKVILDMPGRAANKLYTLALANDFQVRNLGIKFVMVEGREEIYLNDITDGVSITHRSRPSKRTKYGLYDIKKTSVLADLRQIKGFSQAQVAEYFGLIGKKSRDSISQWEVGHSKPHIRHRSRFIKYLWDKLNLRHDLRSFYELWESVMVGEWNWALIQQGEIPSETDTVLNFIPNPPQIKLEGRDSLISILKQILLNGNGPISCSLYGKPGVGKTALARGLIHDQELKDHFIDGILWANVGKYGNALTTLELWGTALKISHEEIRNLTSYQQRVERIIAEIGNRRMLIVLDDVWDKNLAVSLRLDCRNCAHILTTRFPGVAFSFARKNHYEILELDSVSSKNLLEVLASDVVQDWESEVNEFLKAVDGLPLSLILAGHYLNQESKSNQPRRIRQALHKLRNAQERLAMSEPQSPIEKHPSLPAEAVISLGAIIELSYEALKSASKAALQSLSVFPPKPNTFSELSALEISANSPEAMDQIWDYGLMESDVTGRYTLHTSIADYARIKLIDLAVVKRFINYYINYLQTHDIGDDNLDLERINILAAIDTALEQGMNSAFIKGTLLLYGYLEARGLYAQTIEYLNRSIKVAGLISDQNSLTLLLLRLGAVRERAGNYDQAGEYFEEGLGIAKSVENYKLMSYHLSSLGALAYKKGDSKNAEIFMLEGLALARKTDDADTVVRLLCNLGGLAVASGDHTKAEKYLLEALGFSPKVSEPLKLHAAYTNLGVSHEHQGNYPLAEKYYRSALDLSRRFRHRKGLSHDLFNLGIVLDNQGKHLEATVRWEEALNIASEIGHKEITSLILTNLGYAAIESGDSELATSRFEKALAVGLEIHNADKIAMAYEGLGTLAGTLLDYEKAESYLNQAIQSISELKNPLRTCSILIKRSKYLLQQHRLDSAAATLGEIRLIARNSDLKEHYAESLFLLGQVELGKGRSVKACQLVRKSEWIFTAIKHHKATEVKSWREEHCL